MEIILLENVKNLGKIGSIVNVKNGFGRNYLIPKKKALRATKSNLDYFEQAREGYERRNEEQKHQAQVLSEKINGMLVDFVMPAQTNGRLYGSVSVRDLSARLAEQGFAVPRSKIDLPIPLHEVGFYEVRITLHADIACSIRVAIGSNREEVDGYIEKACGTPEA